MKKFLAMLLAAVMVLSLAACGSDGGNTSAADGESTESTGAATTGEKGKIAYFVGNLGDKSFNDSGYVGLQELEKEGYTVKVVETGGPEFSDKFEDYMRDTIEGGYDYVVSSSTYQEPTEALAVEYPDVKFVLFDMSSSYEPPSENITCISYAQNEGSYLVGMVAASMTETGVVAINIGTSNPVISDFMVGFVEGVKAYDPSIKVVSGEVGNWTDAAKMKDICETQYRDNNADVFYQVAGGAGAGVFLFCSQNKGTWAIGVDADQYEEFVASENPEYADVILTSMLKEVGNSFILLFHDIEAGEDIWGKTTVLGLSEDGVGFVENDMYKENVPSEVQEKVTKAKEDIAAGTITVKSYTDFASQAEFESYMDEVAP